MGPRKIMIIRHAEKPPKAGPPPQGVDIDGHPNKNDLIPQGWQRAGALVTVFAARDGRDPRAPIERPGSVYAAGAPDASSSRRPQSTVTPIALALGQTNGPIVLGAPGSEADAAETILASPHDVCLVAWEHKRIKDLVDSMTDGAVHSPHWDGTRFDVTLVLTRADAAWSLDQVPQMLLAGDMMDPVSVRNPTMVPEDD